MAYIAIPFLALVFWFWAAPTPRFAGVAFWWLGGGAISLAFLVLQKPMVRFVSTFALTILSFVIAIALHINIEIFVDPGINHGFHEVPVAEMKPFTTRSGLKLLTPVDGDQCWDADLPCTPYPQEILRLREADDLQSGFELSRGR